MQLTHVTVTLVLILFVNLTTSTFSPWEDVDETKQYESMPIGSAFQKWMKRYKRTYIDDYYEYSIRLRVWMRNYQQMKTHNYNRRIMKETSYFKGMNQFADKTFEEVQKTFLRAVFVTPSGLKQWYVEPEIFIDAKWIPALDWRWVGDKNWLTDVKYQGEGPFGWAAATTDALEFQHFKATGRKVTLSIQELIDCTPEHGRHGATVKDALEYTYGKGLRRERQYPQRSTTTYRPCHKELQSVPSTTHTSGINHVTTKNFRTLEKAIGDNGPMILYLQVTPDFIQYKSGVFHYEPSDDPVIVNHAVLLVGYETDESVQRIWIVKNSWGSDWGEDGYMRIAQNGANRFADFVIFPSVT